MRDYKHSTIYQIYPKSFYDSNGDGIGDIRGIVERLGYIKSLGVDYIWSTPFFVSPMNDNGYDVADYLNINPMFGSMEDVEELICEAGKLGIGIMLDMVFNHTSTEHEWFKKALSGDKKYMDYYFFKDGEPDSPPTNWQSKFGGSAWEYVPALKKWYLHLFDVSQADLNWNNPAVREELKNVIRFWKEKGIKGFRFDVVNLISKPDVFQDDLEGDGRRFYTDGPHIHEFLKELVADTQIEEMVTVGEMSSTTIEDCIRYTDPSERELSMCFNFHHLKVDYKDGNKWELQKADYAQLYGLFREWQMRMQDNNGWNAVFWCNHDQPRIVSRMGDEGRYWKESAKMLATVIHAMRGTPYVYQGEELGMTNAHFSDINDYRDVESLNYYKILLDEGKSEKEALTILSERSRDNSRTPMQWDESLNAGFSKAEPWIGVSDNYESINTAAEDRDDSSILNYYRALIALRKEYEAISDGMISFVDMGDPEIMAYRRYTEDQEILVLANFAESDMKLPETVSREEYKMLLSNYEGDDAVDICSLRPYESIVLLKKM